MSHISQIQTMLSKEHTPKGNTRLGRKKFKSNMNSLWQNYAFSLAEVTEKIIKYTPAKYRKGLSK